MLSNNIQSEYGNNSSNDKIIDKDLLQNGDTRNVVDKYRFWTNQAIKTDMAKTARPFEIAVENLQRDFNVGSIIRSANAFGTRRFHLVGRRSVNRRGAMVTDKYIDMNYFVKVSDLDKYAKSNNMTIVGIDILVGLSKSLENYIFPPNPILFFGSESQGLSKPAQKIC
ncbi:MAG: hypothetical protein LBT99_00675, partial [Bifidobacteriaceae bacterium]|nr:hypothetical protein [Bifidobacteriaceae bacterium]